MNIAAIMPCRGRHEQTVTNVRRLLATAGYEDWGLYLIVDDDAPLTRALFETNLGGPAHLDALKPCGGCWRCLARVTEHTDAPLLVNLANDLWACDDWLKLAIEEYQHRFGDGDGLLGFAGDGHGQGHSCHFLISRALLDRYGGWPVWYSHNFGDTELCQRARGGGHYWKSSTAWLEHCHPERGTAPDDEVYAAGRATYRQDEALFVERRAAGWPVVSR